MTCCSATSDCRLSCMVAETASCSSRPVFAAPGGVPPGGTIPIEVSAAANAAAFGAGVKHCRNRCDRQRIGLQRGDGRHVCQWQRHLRPVVHLGRIRLLQPRVDRNRLRRIQTRRPHQRRPQHAVANVRAHGHEMGATRLRGSLEFHGQARIQLDLTLPATPSKSAASMTTKVRTVQA